MKWLALAALLVLPRAGFTIADDAGKHLDILCDGRIVARYMYQFDAAKLTDTYKPYLHVFDPEGKTPITKGPGGLFPHHRGIFVGWNKIGFNGKTYDRWHMPNGQQIHQKFFEQKVDVEHAEFGSLVHWNDETGKPLLEEERRFVVRKPAAGYVQIDVRSTLKATAGDLDLGGDPEHAGVHYRPADELDKTKTVYLYPKEDAKPHKDLDYPWVGMTYVLGGKTYSVVEMSLPTNPKGAKWSAYRNYGRFGVFFTAKVKSGESLAIGHRFVIGEGELPPVETIQKIYNEFAGTSDPAPKTTSLPAEK